MLVLRSGVVLVEYMMSVRAIRLCFLCIPRSLWLYYPGLYIPFSLRTGDTESNRLADRLLEATSREGYHVPRYSIEEGDKLNKTQANSPLTYVPQVECLFHVFGVFVALGDAVSEFL